MNTKEMKDFFIQERIATYFEKNKTNSQTEYDKANEFMKSLKEKCPNLLDDFRKYLDSSIENIENDQKELYLFGVKDGIRLMKEIMQISF